MAAKMAARVWSSVKITGTSVLEQRCHPFSSKLTASIYLTRMYKTTCGHERNGQLCILKEPLLITGSNFKFQSLNFREIVEPITQRPHVGERYTKTPIGIPNMPFHEGFELPTSWNTNDQVVIDDQATKEEFVMSSLIKKRRKKMNKHKYKKRIHRDIAKIRKIRNFRLRKKRGRQAHKKRLLIKKLTRVLEKNPKADLPNRPYVIHRLKNW